MTRTGSNARKQAARQVAETEGITYTEALWRLVGREAVPAVSPRHADRACPPDCPTACAVDDELPPWEQQSCPTHQPDAHAGWYLEGAYPLTRREFLTNGSDDGCVTELKMDEDFVTTVPELAAFRARLSAVAQADFDRYWQLIMTPRNQVPS